MRIPIMENRYLLEKQQLFWSRTNQSFTLLANIQQVLTTGSHTACTWLLSENLITMCLFRIWQNLWAVLYCLRQMSYSLSVSLQQLLFTCKYKRAGLHLLQDTSAGRSLRANTIELFYSNYCSLYLPLHMCCSVPPSRQLSCSLASGIQQLLLICQSCSSSVNVTELGSNCSHTRAVLHCKPAQI